MTPIHKTGHIYFVLLQKRTSTLKITRRQKSAHKFSPQFTPCTKAFGQRGRYVCDLASIPNSTCWWPGAESAQKEGHLYISTKKGAFSDMHKAQRSWTQEQLAVLSSNGRHWHPSLGTRAKAESPSTSRATPTVHHGGNEARRPLKLVPLWFLLHFFHFIVLWIILWNYSLLKTHTLNNVIPKSALCGEKDKETVLQASLG